MLLRKGPKVIEANREQRVGNKEEDDVKNKSYIQEEFIDNSGLIDKMLQKMFKKRECSQS